MFFIFICSSDIHLDHFVFTWSILGEEMQVKCIFKGETFTFVKTQSVIILSWVRGVFI